MLTRQEAIEAAAAVYLEAKLRIETERAIAAMKEALGAAGTAPEGNDRNPNHHEGERS